MDWHKYTRELITVFCSVLFFTGCRSSVFENRVDCEATICLRAPTNKPIPSNIAKYIYLRVFDDGFLGESSSVTPDAMNKGILFMRPKNSEFRWSVLMNWPGDEAFWYGRRLVVPNETTFPKAYADYLVTELTGDDYQECIVRMRPLFTEIKITISEGIELDFNINSSFGGYSDPELDVFEGSYKNTYHVSGESKIIVPNILLSKCVASFEYDSKQYTLDFNDMFISKEFVGDVSDDSPMTIDIFIINGDYVKHSVNFQSFTFS